MKIINDKTGRFPYRLWFEAGEIDSLMEEHLAKFNTTIFKIEKPPIPVDNFVENYLRIEFKNYEELSTDDKNILGETCFRKNGQPLIRIDKSLTGFADSQEGTGRYHFTVAHEIFHALYHRSLFTGDANQMTFSDLETENRIQCLNREIDSYTKDVHWSEYQANQGAAALLMPKQMFLEYFKQRCISYGMRNRRSLSEEKNKYILSCIVTDISKWFGTSNQAVGIRLKHLKCLADPKQAEMFEDIDMIAEAAARKS